jgi:hypothetical protein
MKSESLKDFLVRALHAMITCILQFVVHDINKQVKKKKKKKKKYKS